MKTSNQTPLDEEQLITRYFSRSSPHPSIDLGIGDDASIINISNELIAVTTDTLVEGVHFEAGSDANCLGHKALAVNLSDLAAMGAQPLWALLALTMPNADPDWLTAFSNGFFELADQHQVSLIGGDTTRGPLTITVQLIGNLSKDHILRRDKARAGEGIYVTHRIGDSGFAALFGDALKSYPQSYSQCTEKRLRPAARVKEGFILSRYANVAIDISDGIFKDLSRLLSASNVGADIEIDDIPIIPEANRCCPTLESLLKVLKYGEDYELLFTLNDGLIDDLEHALNVLGTPVTRIGTVSEKGGLRCRWQSKPVELPKELGYDHFA